MQEENRKVDTDIEESEIDIMELATTLWSHRKKVLKWCGIGLVIGLIVAFSIPKEYTSSVVLAPEMVDAKASGGGLASLASMAGLSAPGANGVDAVYPQLYPDVLSSVPFMTGLFDVKVETKKDKDTFTVKQYLEDETSAPWWGFILGLPGKIIGLLKSSDDEGSGDHQLNTFQLTQKESLLVEALRKRVTANVDTKTSVITISVMMQDPLVAAMLADTVVSRLQEYITDYRTNKARNDLRYAEKLNEEARANYYAAQQAYADYLDHNQGIAFKSAQTVMERLANEASLAFSLYNQTATRVQQAQAKVQEATPVYAVISPATVAIKPTKPSKAMILIGFVFLAFVASSAWILFLSPKLGEFKNKFKETDNIKNN